MDNEERLKLRAKAQALKPAMNIGKAGLNPSVIDEVVRQLEEHRLMKVKLLAAAREGHDRDSLAKELADLTGAELVEVRGNTAVLWRGRKQKARTAGP